jgi:hypothetical protein
MLTTKNVILSPRMILGVAVVCFGCWLAIDAIRTRPPFQREPESPPPTERHVPPERPTEVLLGIVHPGSPRPIVERHLAPITIAFAEPVEVRAGAVLIREHFHLVLNHPVPRLMPIFPRQPFRPGPHVLIITFDGSRPNHPLLRAELAPADPHGD